MAFEVDYVYNQGRNEKDIIDNVEPDVQPGDRRELSVQRRQPARRSPIGGTSRCSPAQGKSGYHGLQTSFTKRLANRWQASATYTLSALSEAESPAFTGDRATNRFMPVPFATAPDMGGECTLSVADQRHRAVFNGIWEVGRGFQVSGLFYHGSGNRDASFYGGDERQTGADFSQRLRPNGTIVPRNSFIQPMENRVDLRLQQRIPLGGRAAIDLIAEMFNLFNANNFTLVTEEGASDFERAGRQVSTGRCSSGSGSPSKFVISTLKRPAGSFPAGFFVYGRPPAWAIDGSGEIAYLRHRSVRSPHYSQRRSHCMRRS